MDGSVYKIIELNGSSGNSVEDAVQNAISRVSQTIRGVSWFEVSQLRGTVNQGRVAEWQVTLKIGFSVEGEKGQEEKPAAGRVEKISGQNAPKSPGAGFVKYRCKVCGYVYDPEKGDPTQGIKPGTAFEDLPDSWVCPECGVAKDQFEKIK